TGLRSLAVWFAIGAHTGAAGGLPAAELTTIDVRPNEPVFTLTSSPCVPPLRATVRTGVEGARVRFEPGFGAVIVPTSAPSMYTSAWLPVPTEPALRATLNALAVVFRTT